MDHITDKELIEVLQNYIQRLEDTLDDKNDKMTELKELNTLLTLAMLQSEPTEINNIIHLN